MRIKEKSCGCIIVKDGKVLLIEQVSGHWGFPKGHVEHDEEEEQTALREVKEETNLDVKIDSNKRYVEKYITDKGIDKEVVLFVAEPINEEIKMQEEEVSKIKWMSFEEAINQITFEETKQILKQVLRDL